MAKEQSFDGITYYPTKHFPETSCQLCHKRLPQNQVAYRIGSKTSEIFACKRCLREMNVNKQRQLQQNIFVFPKEATLFIGKIGSHKCEVSNEAYEACLATFHNNKASITLQISKCPKCKNFFLSTALFEKHRPVFKDYKLISLKTGKEIVWFSSGNRSIVFAKQTESTIPSSLQQSAFHPYQGGRFSGK